LPGAAAPPAGKNWFFIFLGAKTIFQNFGGSAGLNRSSVREAALNFKKVKGLNFFKHDADSIRYVWLLCMES
jgi:hypothetical protein